MTPRRNKVPEPVASSTAALMKVRTIGATRVGNQRCAKRDLRCAQREGGLVA